MKLMSRIEEIILLAIWRLQDNAYGITIHQEVEKLTGRQWNLGAVYGPLSRLHKNGFVSTKQGEPVAERGGRSKIYYRLTPDAKDALRRIYLVNSTIWERIPPFITAEES